jgi:hypothetical protein
MKDDDINAKKDSSSSNDDDNLNNEISNMNINSHSNRNCLYCLQGSSRCSKCRTALTAIETVN